MRSLLVAAVLLVGGAAFAKSPVTLAPVPGGLVITSTTEGAEVFIDGEKVGTVPLPGPLPLAPGEHTLKVTKPGFAPLIDVFKVLRKAQTKVDADLVPVAGVLRVGASVEQAHVFIDGKFVCEAPCTTEMPVGPRAIQVSKGGFKDYFQNVSSVAGQEIALDVRLEDLPVGLNPYKPPPPPPPKWFEKWWVWTVGVVAAGAIATAIAVPVTEAQKDRIKEFGPSYTFTIGNR